MAIESSTYIADWVTANPASTDPKSEGDDHIRKIKTDVQATFPGLAGRFRRITARSTAYTAVLNDNTSIIRASGTWTLTLTAAATLGNGWEILVYNDGSGTITVDPNGTETINGATTLTIAANTFVWISCNGTLFLATGAPTNSVNLVTTDTAQTITGAKTHDANLTVGTNTTARELVSNGPAGSIRILRFMTSGVGRWFIYGDSDAEAGTDSGTRLRIDRVNDAGNLNTPILLFQRSNGAAQVGNGPVGGFVGTDIWNFAQTPRVNNDPVMTRGASETITGTKTLDANLNVGTSTSSRDLILNGPAGSNRIIRIMSGGTSRWFLYGDPTTESGSDSGTNLRIDRLIDAGTVNTPVFIARRSDGAVQAGNAPTGGFAGADIWNFAQTPRVNNVSLARQIASDGAGLVLLSTLTPAGTADNVDITIPSNYEAVWIHLKELRWNATIARVLRISIDGGSTFQADANGYRAIIHSTDSAGTSHSIQVMSTELQLTSATPAAGTDGSLSGWIKLDNAQDTANHKRFRWDLTYRENASGNLVAVWGQGETNTTGMKTANIDAVRIFSSGGGNLVTGKIYVYGIGTS